MPNDFFVEKEVSIGDLLKRIFNEGGRKKRKPLLDAEARKAKLRKEKEARSQRDKKLRAERLSKGVCTRCGNNLAKLGSKMCSNCQLKGRQYMKGR